MKEHPQNSRSAERGIVLVSSLLLLVVVTIMALSIFRSFGVQEKIAGNTRDKQRALQAATSTQQYAEWWLANASNAVAAVAGGFASSADITCPNTVVAVPQICINPPNSFGITLTSVPWTAGVSYTPPGMNVQTVVANTDNYSLQPEFYVTDTGPPAGGGHGEVYRVDAYGSGVSANTVAVVESTVIITCIVCNLGAI